MSEEYPKVTDPMIAGAEYAYLTTTGRNSSAPHTVELWFVTLDDTIWFLTEDTTDWLRNAVADPAVRVRITSWQWEATAHLEPPSVASELGPRARAAMQAKYEPGYSETLGAWAANATALVATVIEPPLPSIERWIDE